MRRRTATVALTLAVLAPLAGAGVAVAASTHVSASGGKGRAEVRAGAGADRERGKSFVLGGTLTEVDAADSTISLTVRGGREKVLRGLTVVLDVTATAAITRAGTTATLADLSVGDHVSVKTRRTAGTVTVLRVSAAAARTTPSATPSATPSVTPSVTPSATPTPTS